MKIKSKEPVEKFKRWTDSKIGDFCDENDIGPTLADQIAAFLKTASHVHMSYKAQTKIGGGGEMGTLTIKMKVWEVEDE